MIIMHKKIDSHIVRLAFILLVHIYVCYKAEASILKKAPVILGEDSWSKILVGEWMVDFYAPWCPACKKLEPEWRKFAEWSDDLDIKVASADVTENPGLTGRFMISGLPTIYHVKDGIFRIYNGPREHRSMINFIEEQGWKSIEPVSNWWAPNSLQMSFLAHSFRISMTLRDVHNYLVEDVGLPYYISYLVFALCTVILGTVLGLAIVFVIDQLWPTRHSSAVQDVGAKSVVAKKKKTNKTDESNQEDSSATESAQTTTTKSNEQIRRRVK